MWFFAILVVLLLGGIAVVAAGRGQPLVEVREDRLDTVLPDGPLRGQDVRRVRFPLAVRGYRMVDVDALLARLAEQLDERPDHEPGEARREEDGGPDAP